MNKEYPVREVTHPPFTVSIPERFANADMVEIMVRITPMSHIDCYGRSEMRRGDAAYSEAQIVVLQAKDTRYITHVAFEMLRNLMRVYLGVDIGGHP